jgi:hypothetical protein
MDGLAGGLIVGTYHSYAPWLVKTGQVGCEVIKSADRSHER